MKREKHKHEHKNHPQGQTEQITLAVKDFDELKEKSRKADEYYDRLLRLQAEFENTKKRLAREKEDFVKFANDELISSMLPVVDNFRRAVENTHESHSLSDVLAGIKLIERQFEDVLKEFGLTAIETAGKKFDPHYHQAVLQEETDEFEDGMIIEEMQRGYLLNGRLLRPAVVKVAKKPEDRG